MKLLRNSLGASARAIFEGLSMVPGVVLMYVEGEVRDGCLTGRTVLIIETTFEVDVAAPGYSQTAIDAMIASAQRTWAEHYRLPDLVRVIPADRSRSNHAGRRKLAS